MIDGPAHRQFRRITQKWRTLVERQRDQMAELYRTQRWKHYYTEEEFVLRTRTMRRLVELWTKLAPRPSDGELRSDTLQPDAVTGNLDRNAA
jgi:hypothetical protein